MTHETAFRSTDPLVLAFWDLCQSEHEWWLRRMVSSQKQLGRQIYRRFTGLARQEEIVGLQDLPDSAVPVGWRREPGRDFLVPADGPEGDVARAWLAGHQPPVPVERRLMAFGVAEYFTTDDEVFWPGVERLDDGLYVTWGTDTGWDGAGHFSQVPLSVYHAARERSVLSDQAG